MTRPLRILFTTCPLVDQFWPMVPLGWALRAAGHDVQVACLAPIASEVTASGLPALPAVAPAGRKGLVGADEAGTWDQAFSALTGDMRGVIRWNMRVAIALADGTLTAVRSWHPDLIIHAPMDLAGPLLSGLLRVPAVLHSLGLPLRDVVAAGMHRGCLALQVRYGVPGDFAEPLMVLDVCPPGFGPGQPDGDRVQPMRYTPYSGAGAVPAWTREPSPVPRVCIMKSIEPPEEAEVPFLLRVAGEVAGDDIDVLLPLPESALAGIDPAAYPGITLTEWLPPHHLAAGSAVAVHGGDSASTLTFLGAGAPQLLVPWRGQENRNAEALEAVGAGRLLPNGSPPARLAAAVRELARDESCRAAARSLARTMWEMPSPLSVATRIEALLNEADGPASRPVPLAAGG